MIKTCFCCKSRYETTHATKEEAFETKDMNSREQWLSGCCSQDCWDGMFPEELETELDLTIGD